MNTTASPFRDGVGPLGPAARTQASGAVYQVGDQFFEVQFGGTNGWRFPRCGQGLGTTLSRLVARDIQSEGMK